MYERPLKALIEAIETGLTVNPELTTQTDDCKRGVWREMVGPALRDAKAAARLSLSAEQLTLLYITFNFVATQHNQLHEAQRSGMVVMLPPEQADMFEQVGRLGTDLLNQLRELATVSSIQEITE